MTERHRPAPSAEHAARYENFIHAAAAYGHRLNAWRAGERAGATSAEALLKTRKLCRESVMPVDQQFPDSALMRLLRLVDKLAPLGLPERADQADELVRLAREIDPRLDPGKQPTPRPASEPRKPYAD